MLRHILLTLPKADALPMRPVMVASFAYAHITVTKNLAATIVWRNYEQREQE
jgi:hypothetical protein